MRITPVDKPPDGDGDSGRSSSRRPSSLREYVSRFCSRALALVATLGPSARGERTDDSRPGEETRETNALQPVEDERVSFADFPNRDRPLVQPARDSTDVNTPDVVGVQTEEGLRLSVPENPDAELVSDVWTSVEP